MRWEEVESAQDHALRMALEESDQKRMELVKRLKPGETVCNHLDPHIIPVVEGVELDFRNFMEKSGWFRSGGYCPAYYPMWLRYGYRRGQNPTLPVLKEEPKVFGEGGEWVPNVTKGS